MRSAGKNRLKFHGWTRGSDPLPLEKSLVAIGGCRNSGRDPHEKQMDPLVASRGRSISPLKYVDDQKKTLSEPP